MQTVTLPIPGIHAQAMSLHLLLVIKAYATGKKAGSIPTEKMDILSAMDQAHFKLDDLAKSNDDETPQPLSLTIPEAEAMIRAFTDAEFKDPALLEPFYQTHSYTSYFGLIYAKYLKMLSERYVEALAAV